MYVYVIICVQLKQNIVIKQVENSIFTFSYHHLSWTGMIVNVA